MKAEPINSKDALDWLYVQNLTYASRNAAGGVRAHLEYDVAKSHWIVRISTSNVLYRGPDVEEAVRIFNENSY